MFASRLSATQVRLIRSVNSVLLMVRLTPKTGEEGSEGKHDQASMENDKQQLPASSTATDGVRPNCHVQGQNPAGTAKGLPSCFHINSGKGQGLARFHFDLAKVHFAMSLQ